MVDGMMIFSPRPSRSLEDSIVSIVGKEGFRILAITFGRIYKATCILAAFNPTLGVLS